MKILDDCGLLLQLDDEDYDRISKFSWHITGDGCGGVRTTIRLSQTEVINISLASEIMGDRNTMFDHKDRNPLNNQKENLRPCNASTNGINRTKFILNGTSKHKGVGWNARDKKWQARITVKRKVRSLGYFLTEIEAAKAYNTAAVELFGEFAVLNQICQTT